MASRCTPPRSIGCAPPGLPGSKEGCAEGECGACAVLLATPAVDGGTAWIPVNSCLVPVYALDGQEVVTAEGLGTPDALHPVQRGLAEGGGSQCGYCTPGFACSMAARVLPRRPPTGRAHADAPDARARPERIRSARPERQPVPLHRLPADPRRRVRIGDAGGRTTRSPPAASTPRPRRCPPTWSSTAPASCARPRSARRWRCCGTSRGRGWWPAPPTGASMSTSAARRAPLVVAIDRLAELRTLTIGDDVIEIGAALTLSEVEQRSRRPGAAAGRADPAVRLAASSATAPRWAATSAPPLRSATSRPLCWPSAPASCWPRSTVSASIDLAEYFTGYRESVRRGRRADPRRPDPPAAGRGHRVPQDRQAPVRRHLERRDRLRARHPRRRRDRRPDRSGRRRGHADPRLRHGGDGWSGEPWNIATVRAAAGGAGRRRARRCRITERARSIAR